MNMNTLSPLAKAMRIATAGMQAQDQRILIISQNLANAGAKATPGTMPYQRKTISFQTVLDKKQGVELLKLKKIGRDTSPMNKSYNPHDPAANKDGYVLESNVKPMIELADMREASRSHEANLRAFEKSLSMFQNTISLLK
ncbi:MAG: flagellar basal body rod protein FlgC [Alphaproteobacteria bacterium]|nr:flagellar basal body rod protein FlgC [Alphaproteobacteria bacterium]